MKKVRRPVTLLGVGFDAVNYRQAVATVLSWVRTRKRTYMCFVNVYALMTYQKDPSLRETVNNAGLVVTDGMPLVWAGKLYDTRVSRVYGTTFVRKLLETEATPRLRHFFLGGQTGQSGPLRAGIRRRYPRALIAGTYETPDRPMSPLDTARAIRHINASRADIVYIGLGVPHQELWIRDNRHAIRASVLMGVGSTFDFLSGSKHEAPEWMQVSGLEWAYRFIQEPRRLWYRYTVVSARFIASLLGQLCRDFMRGAFKNPQA